MPSSKKSNTDLWKWEKSLNDTFWKDGRQTMCNKDRTYIFESTDHLYRVLKP